MGASKKKEAVTDGAVKGIYNSKAKKILSKRFPLKFVSKWKYKYDHFWLDLHNRYVSSESCLFQAQETRELMI